MKVTKGIRTDNIGKVMYCHKTAQCRPEVHHNNVRENGRVQVWPHTSQHNRILFPRATHFEVMSAAACRVTRHAELGV